MSVVLCVVVSKVIIGYMGEEVKELLQGSDEFVPCYLVGEYSNVMERRTILVSVSSFMESNHILGFADVFL